MDRPAAGVCGAARRRCKGVEGDALAAVHSREGALAVDSGMAPTSWRPSGDASAAFPAPVLVAAAAASGASPSTALPATCAKRFLMSSSILRLIAWFSRWTTYAGSCQCNTGRCHDALVQERALLCIIDFHSQQSWRSLQHLAGEHEGDLARQLCSNGSHDVI